MQTMTVARLGAAAIRFDGRGGAQLTVARDGDAIAVPLDRDALWALAMQAFGALEAIEPAHGRGRKA